MFTEQLPLFSSPPLETETAPLPHSALGLNAATPLKAVIVAWRHYMEKEDVSLNTIKAFGGDLNLFAQHVGASKSVGQLTTRELNDWLQWQRTTKKCSPKTYARRVTSLKSFFRWLNHDRVIYKDPAAALVQHTVLSPLPEYLKSSEVEQALQAAQALSQAEKPDLRPLLLFRLLLQTGMKKSECLGLSLNHLDLANADEPVVWVRYPDTRHRYKERKLKLEKSWVALYRQYLAQYAPTEKVFPWSPRRLEYLLEDISQTAGLTKHISFEMCRWTCAVRDAQAGMDYNSIRQKLGLSKIQWREIGMKLERLVEEAT